MLENGPSACKYHSTALQLQAVKPDFFFLKYTWYILPCFETCNIFQRCTRIAAFVKQGKFSLLLYHNCFSTVLLPNIYVAI